MRLKDVMEEVAQQFGTIVGTKTYPYPVASVTAPAGIVHYPESVDYDQTYQRGQDQITDLPVMFVVGKPTDKSSWETATKWADGSGPSSVKAALEAHSYSSCDDVTVDRCDFGVVAIAGIEYLAVTFSCNIVGPGEDD